MHSVAAVAVAIVVAVVAVEVTTVVVVEEIDIDFTTNRIKKPSWKSGGLFLWDNSGGLEIAQKEETD